MKSTVNDLNTRCELCLILVQLRESIVEIYTQKKIDQVKEEDNI